MLGFFYPSANLSFIASEVFKMPEQINYAKLRFSASGGVAVELFLILLLIIIMLLPEVYGVVV